MPDGQAMRDLGGNVVGMHRIQFGASQTLRAAIEGVSGTVSKALKRIVISPESGVTIRGNIDAAASATTAQIPASMLPCDYDYTARWYLYGDGYATVLQIA